MNQLNKKSINLAILLAALVLVLSTIAYAKPFTEAFRGGLLSINSFFTGQQYKAYAETIDFVFFALLFIAIYMMGARYAFKEVKRPEQVIVILLGLMTAFLLVLGGFSATLLLPYLPWLLYTLLFIFYWWLLKGINNKFWRFVLALLLTLLTIALLQGLFGSLTAPDSQGFFSSFGRSLSSLKFPEISGTPGIPPYLSDLFGTLPSTTTPSETPSTTGPVTPTETPKSPGPTPHEPSKGLPWWAWVLIGLAVLALLYSGYRFWPRRAPPTPGELTIGQEMDDIIRKKRESITKINITKDEKNRIVQAADKRQAFLNKLATEDIALLFTDPAKQRINQEGGAFKELLDTEVKLITELKDLKDVEINLYNKLEQWKTKVSPLDITPEAEFLKNLIGRKTTIRDIRNMGIAWLIALCYDFEKREIMLSKELQQLMQEYNVEELVKGKFVNVKSDQRKLGSYIGYETGIIKLLEQKIAEQIRKLEELKRKISSPASSPYGAPPYGRPPYGAPYGVPYGAPAYGTPSYGGAPRTGRMKVLMISFAHPSASNGISTVIHHLMPALSSLGVEVELLTKWYGEPFFFYPAGSSSMQQFNTIDEFLATKSVNEYSFIHAHAVTFAEQINPPDPATYWDKLLGYFKVPSAYTVHFLNRYNLMMGKWRKYQYDARKWVGDFLEPYILDRVNVIIQLNKSFTQITDEIYPGKDYSKKTVIIPNGVDFSGITLKIKPKSDEIDLLYLGRFDRNKGIYELCVAFGELYKKYPKLKLHIVGEGAPRGEYSDFEAETIKRILRRVKVPPDRFIIYGAKYGKEKEDIINNSDFVIVPSYTEIFCMVALEAISHKKPLIASTALGLKETFIDTGLAYPIDFGELRYTDPSDSQKHYKLRVKKIVEAVSYCVEHKDECERRAELAYQFLQTHSNIFDWKEIAARTKELYEYLIATGKVPKIEITIPKMSSPGGRPYTPPPPRTEPPRTPPHGPTPPSGTPPGPIELIISLEDPAKDSLGENENIKIKVSLNNYTIPPRGVRLSLFKILGRGEDPLGLYTDMKENSITVHFQASALGGGTHQIFAKILDLYPGATNPDLKSNIIAIRVISGRTARVGGDSGLYSRYAGQLQITSNRRGLSGDKINIKAVLDAIREIVAVFSTNPEFRVPPNGETNLLSRYITLIFHPDRLKDKTQEIVTLYNEIFKAFSKYFEHPTIIERGNDHINDIFNTIQLVDEIMKAIQNISDFAATQGINISDTLRFLGIKMRLLVQEYDDYVERRRTA